MERVKQTLRYLKIIEDINIKLQNIDERLESIRLLLVSIELNTRKGKPNGKINKKIKTKYS